VRVVILVLYLEMSAVNVVRGIFEFGDVKRIDTGSNRFRSFLLNSLATVHQIRLHVRVYTCKQPDPPCRRCYVDQAAFLSPSVYYAMAVCRHVSLQCFPFPVT